MLKRKKIFSLILGLVLVFSSSACDGVSENSNNKNDGSGDRNNLPETQGHNVPDDAGSGFSSPT